MSSASSNNQTTIQYIKDTIINLNSDEKNDILFFIVNNITGVDTNSFSIAIDEPLDVPVASVEESKAEPPIEVSTAEPFIDIDDESYLKDCLLWRWEIMLTELPKIICENLNYRLLSVEPNIIKWENVGNTPGRFVNFVDSSGKTKGLDDNSPIEKSITKILRKHLVEYYSDWTRSGVHGEDIATKLHSEDCLEHYKHYNYKIIKVNIKYVVLEYSNKTNGRIISTCKKSILNVYPPPIEPIYQYTDEAIALDVEIGKNRIRVMSRYDLECCVCYEPCNTKVGTCGHPICAGCCGQIRIGNNFTCPMCRGPMNYLRGPFNSSRL